MFNFHVSLKTYKLQSQAEKSGFVTRDPGIPGLSTEPSCPGAGDARAGASEQEREQIPRGRGKSPH